MDRNGGDLDRRLLALLDQMIGQQELKVRRVGSRLLSSITLDDVLSPDDVPALRSDPDFLYEDGILAGLLSSQAAIRALLAEHRSPPPVVPDGQPDPAGH